MLTQSFYSVLMDRSTLFVFSAVGKAPPCWFEVHESSVRKCHFSFQKEGIDFLVSCFQNSKNLMALMDKGLTPIRLVSVFVIYLFLI